MNKIRSLFFLIIGMLIISSSTLIAQEESTPVKITVSELTLNTEKIIFETHQLKVSVFKKLILDNGIHHERITFKYVNKTSEAISFKFKKHNIYDGSSSKGEGVDRVIELEANSVQEYSQINKGKSYYSFSRDLNGSIKAKLDYIILNQIIIS